MKPGERSVVTPEDHAAALALVTEWQRHQVVPANTTAELLELVGMIAATRAEARAEARAVVADYAQQLDALGYVTPATLVREWSRR